MGKRGIIQPCLPGHLAAEMRKLRCKVLIGLTQGKTVCQASPEARIPVSSLPDQYYICSPPRGLHLRMYSEILQIKLIWIYINLKQASKQANIHYRAALLQYTLGILSKCRFRFSRSGTGLETLHFYQAPR